ncbi:g6690 [Coccomyxa elongata]
MMSAAAALVPVLSATNRAKNPQPGTGRDNFEPLYAEGKIGDLTYGTCKVHLPAGRKIGSAEAVLPEEVKEVGWTEDVKDKS